MTGSRPSAALPHTGIATFCKAPYVFDPQKIQADIVVLGVPFDGMASMRPGCRQGHARVHWRLPAQDSTGT